MSDLLAGSRWLHRGRKKGTKRKRRARKEVKEKGERRRNEGRREGEKGKEKEGELARSLLGRYTPLSRAISWST